MHCCHLPAETFIPSGFHYQISCTGSRIYRSCQAISGRTQRGHPASAAGFPCSWNRCRNKCLSFLMQPDMKNILSCIHPYRNSTRCAVRQVKTAAPGYRKRGAAWTAQPKQPYICKENLFTAAMPAVHGSWCSSTLAVEIHWNRFLLNRKQFHPDGWKLAAQNSLFAFPDWAIPRSMLK